MDAEGVKDRLGMIDAITVAAPVNPDIVRMISSVF
jgi:hypothetical protein